MSQELKHVGNLEGRANLWSQSCYEQWIERPLLHSYNIPCLSQHLNKHLLVIRDTIKPIRTKLRIWTFVLILVFLMLLQSYKILQVAVKHESQNDPYYLKLNLLAILIFYFMGFVLFTLAFQYTSLFQIRLAGVLLILTTTVYMLFILYFQRDFGELCKEWIFYIIFSKNDANQAYKETEYYLNINSSYFTIVQEVYFLITAILLAQFIIKVSIQLKKIQSQLQLAVELNTEYQSVVQVSSYSENME